MKKLLFLLLLISPALCAQELKVKSFVENTQDLSARTNPRNDLNGVPCALVKVELAVEAAQFSGNVMGEVERKVNTYWVYMSAGSKRLKVMHPNFLTLNVEFADYNIAEVQRNSTYVLSISMSAVATGPARPVVTQQYVLFNVQPKDAVVELADQVLEVADGTAQKRMSFGTYKYKVQAPMYHPAEGVVEVNDPKAKHIVNVELRPAFGFLSVPGTGDLAGAKVYVDDELVGSTPYRSGRLASGLHKVRVVRPMYSPVAETVTITDNETLNYSPSLSADFATITIEAPADGEIWINEEKKGTGRWHGQLPTGAYRLECRKKNHRRSIQEITVQPSMDGQMLTLAAPTPIYGSIDISSVPANADVYVDNVKVGTSPMLIPEILIGEHQVKLVKEGYAEYVSRVTVKKDETLEVSSQLSNFCKVNFTCDIPGTKLTIDGKDVGEATGAYNVPMGSHKVKAKYGEFVMYSSDVNVTANMPTVRITPQNIKVVETNGPGSLMNLISNPSSLRALAIKGIIGEEDFKFLRVQCPDLRYIDMSGVMGLVKIPNYAFYNFDKLLIVLLPVVTSIGEKAFLGCSSLKSVSIPNSVTSIGKYAFWDCSSLTSITLSSSTKVANNVFDSKVSIHYY